MSQSETATPANSGVSTASTVMMTAAKLCLTFPPLRQKIETNSLPFVETALWMYRQIATYRQAWVEHPQYAYWRSLSELAWMPFDNPSWAMVVMALKHPPGIGQHEYSFVVCSVDELTLALQWASSPKVGEFAGVFSISEEFDALPYRFALYSYSAQGKARGYLARMEMKRLLPTKLRKYVSRYRTHKKITKREYLAWPLRVNENKPFIQPGELQHGTHGEIGDWEKANKERLPDWYRQMSKAELWAEWIAASEPVLFAQIDYWIAPTDFYRAVTGDIHPDNVKALFKRLPRTAVEQPAQMEMFK